MHTDQAEPRRSDIHLTFGPQPTKRQDEAHASVYRQDLREEHDPEEQSGIGKAQLFLQSRATDGRDYCGQLNENADEDDLRGGHVQRGRCI